MAQDSKFQASRRPRRTAPVLVAALFLALGLGALVKPPPPTPGAPTAAPKGGAAPRTPPAHTAADTRRPASAPSAGAQTTQPRSLGDPRKISGCLVSLGFKAGELQKVPLNLWQAVSSKFLADGDVNLFVCGSSASTVKTIELEATASADCISTALGELLRALPVLLKELGLPMPNGLAAAIEKDNAAATTAETTMNVAGVRIDCIARTLGDQRSVRVRLTQGER